MTIRESIGSLFKVAVVGACVYGFVKWGPLETENDDIGDFAERDCIDEIRSRYDVSRISVYELSKRDDGYAVRASVTLARGPVAKATCLTNRQGGVREVVLDER
jgi:hypothetical protein